MRKSLSRVHGIAAIATPRAQGCRRWSHHRATRYIPRRDIHEDGEQWDGVWPPVAAVLLFPAVPTDPQSFTWCFTDGCTRADDENGATYAIWRFVALRVAECLNVNLPRPPACCYTTLAAVLRLRGDRRISLVRRPWVHCTISYTFVCHYKNMSVWLTSLDKCGSRRLLWSVCRMYMCVDATRPLASGQCAAVGGLRLPL